MFDLLDDKNGVGVVHSNDEKLFPSSGHLVHGLKKQEQWQLALTFRCPWQHLYASVSLSIITFASSIARLRVHSLFVPFFTFLFLILNYYLTPIPLSIFSLSFA